VYILYQSDEIADNSWWIFISAIFFIVVSNTFIQKLVALCIDAIANMKVDEGNETYIIEIPTSRMPEFDAVFKTHQSAGIYSRQLRRQLLASDSVKFSLYPNRRQYTTNDDLEGLQVVGEKNIIDQIMLFVMKYALKIPKFFSFSSQRTMLNNVSQAYRRQDEIQESFLDSMYPKSEKFDLRSRR